MLLTYIYHSTTSHVLYTVRPMYTWDIENRQHWNMLEYRRRQIADIHSVKNSKHATTLKLRTTTHGRPHMLPDRCGSRRCRWSTPSRYPPRRTGVRRDRCDTEARVICVWWTALRHYRRLAVCSSSCRLQMTVVEIIITNQHCLSNSGRNVCSCNCM